MEGFIGPTPNIPVDALQFISLLNLSPIVAVLRSFYVEPYKIKHPQKLSYSFFASRN